MSQSVSNRKAAELQASIREILERLAEAEALTEASLLLREKRIRELEAENKRLREQNRRLIHCRNNDSDCKEVHAA